jgi:periplasmic protein TonB
MLRSLPESGRRRRSRPVGVVLSVLAHLVIVILAARATGMTTPPPPEKPVRDTVVWIEPQPQRTPQPVATASTGGAPQTRANEPAFVAPIVVPDVILPPDSNITRTIEGNRPPGVLDRVFDGPASVSATGGAPTSVGNGPMDERFVDRPIFAFPGTPGPRYPDGLRRIGVEGRVVVRFIVDTAGRVERNSIQKVSADHDAFFDAVVRSLTDARFQPAESNGRRVRQLAERSYEFRIEKP